MLTVILSTKFRMQIWELCQELVAKHKLPATAWCQPVSKKSLEGMWIVEQLIAIVFLDQNYNLHQQ